jgi:hypothetical protein
MTMTTIAILSGMIGAGVSFALDRGLPLWLAIGAGALCGVIVAFGWFLFRPRRPRPQMQPIRPGRGAVFR